MGSFTSSLDLFHFRSLAIFHKGGQARATFRNLPCGYMFSSYNTLIRVHSRAYQIISPLCPPCGASRDVVLFDTILTIPDYEGQPQGARRRGGGDAPLVLEVVNKQSPSMGAAG